MTEQDSTVTVTIGRNVDGVPMQTAQWQAFKEDLTVWAAGTFGDLYFVGEGRGDSPQWGAEDAFTVVGGFRSWRYWGDSRDDLDKLREEYGQEAVAVTFGTTTFV